MPNHIHFLGIAGIGVSALAQLAQARGVRVSGSDPNADPVQNPAIARLLAGGATLFTTHEAANLAADVDLVVASAAVAEDNPEIRAARANGIAVVSRAEFLGQLMAAHKGPKIAVAGTHGKTTTTGMIGVMLQHAGLNPTVFVGGEVPELGGNVRVGSETGPFVAEACEAYDSFLYLKPDIAVITNIEADHLDYYGTEERVFDAFGKFISNVSQEEGLVIFVADEERKLDGLIRKSKRQNQICSFQSWDGPVRGFVRNTTYALNLRIGHTTTFDCYPYPIGGPIPIQLHVPGEHNALNALAAITLAADLIGLNREVAELAHSAFDDNLSKEEQAENQRRLNSLMYRLIAEGLAQFRGATRRQEVLGEGKLRMPEDSESVLVMDDYAHHPTEIRATLDALRSAYPGRRLVAIFQPHLYSRTRDFLDQFAQSLSQADALIVTDIYAAREAPIEGVRAEDIVTHAVAQNPNLPAVYMPDKRDIPARLLRDFARPGDVCVFLGAGDIRDEGEAFLKNLHPCPEAAA